jgi:hypothetical protein
LRTPGGGLANDDNCCCGGACTGCPDYYRANLDLDLLMDCVSCAGNGYQITDILGVLSGLSLCLPRSGCTWEKTLELSCPIATEYSSTDCGVGDEIGYYDELTVSATLSGGTMTIDVYADGTSVPRMHLFQGSETVADCNDDITVTNTVHSPSCDGGVLWMNDSTASTVTLVPEVSCTDPVVTVTDPVDVVVDVVGIAADTACRNCVDELGPGTDDSLWRRAGAAAIVDNSTACLPYGGLGTLALVDLVTYEADATCTTETARIDDWELFIEDLGCDYWRFRIMLGSHMLFYAIIFKPDFTAPLTVWNTLLYGCFPIGHEFEYTRKIGQGGYIVITPC